MAKIIDWGKYKYETEKRAKEARKKQHVVEVKEVKMRYKIDTHDYEVRMKAARKFLAQQNKVKLVVMLRGREIQHNKLAFDLANKFLEDIKEVKIETPYGMPSDSLFIGKIGAHKVAFMPRHNREHSIPPHLINYRANVWAMKEAGCKRVISPCFGKITLA